MNSQKSTNLEIKNGIATLTLCREGKGNSLNLPMVIEINHAVKKISSDPSVKVIIINSSNPEFCVGGDIDYIFNSDELPQNLLSEMIQLWHKTIIFLTTCPQVVLVSISGPVAGGGLGIMLAADYVIANVNSHFSAGFITLGLSCDSGLSWFLPRQIGFKRAKQFLLTGEPIMAEKALDWGLVDALVESDEEKKTVEELAIKLSKMSPVAVKKIKNLLNQSFDNDLTTHMYLEQESIVDAAGSDDVKTCVTGFLTRRKNKTHS